MTESSIPLVRSTYAAVIEAAEEMMQAYKARLGPKCQLQCIEDSTRTIYTLNCAVSNSIEFKSVLTITWEGEFNHAEAFNLVADTCLQTRRQYGHLPHSLPNKHSALLQRTLAQSLDPVLTYFPTA